jgi:hypothetical protein
MYKSVSVELSSFRKEESGTYVTVGFGRSPKQARQNAKCVSGHHVNGTPVLGDYAYFLNGKKIIVDPYSDKLIADDGRVTI